MMMKEVMMRVETKNGEPKDTANIFSTQKKVVF